MKEENWLKLWRELVKANFQPKTERLVERYEAHARKRTERPDPLLDFVISEVSGQDTVIDIGSGTGRWTIPLAKKAKSVTAIEPSSAMINILKENLDQAGLSNVSILSQTWEEAAAQKHDFTVSSHAIYGSPDLEAFVHKMELNTRKRCCLALRLPPADGILGELSLKIHGRRHDSPDAVIAYNALYTMGIYANMLVESGIVNWVNATVEEAFLRAKRHLRLETDETYDDLIRSTLNIRLKVSNGVYQWPDGMRSALLWWYPNQKS